MKTANASALTPAAAYIRMSDDKQEMSPADQRAELDKLAAKHGCQIVGEYLDAGISGSERGKKRPEFQRLIADAQAGKFTSILCWDQDRFSRFDPVEFNHYVFLLREAGVGIITATKGPIKLDELGDWLTASVNQHAKHAYLHDLSRNVVRGRSRCAATGAWSGRPPFGFSRAFHDEHGQFQQVADVGYRKPKKSWSTRLVPNEDAETVRFMFQTLIERRCSIRHLVTLLAAKGSRSPEGKQWCHITARLILTNPAYTGDTIQGKIRSGKFGHIEPATIADTHEGLVSREDFAIVQEMIAAGRIGSSPRKEAPYPLSTLLRCGHCGGPVVGRTQAAKSGKSRRPITCRYYTCNHHSTHGTCEHRAVRAEIVEEAVLELLQNEILNPENLEAIRAEVRTMAAASVDGKASAHKADAAEKQLAKLTRQIEKGTANLLSMDAAMVPAVSKMLAELTERRDRLKAEVASVVEEPTAGAGDAEEAIDALLELRESIQDADPLVLRDLMRQTFSRITLWWKATTGTSGRTVQRLVRGQAELDVSETFAPPP